jgi:hypothetical protein
VDVPSTKNVPAPTTDGCAGGGAVAVGAGCAGGVTGRRHIENGNSSYIPEGKYGCYITVCQNTIKDHELINIAIPKSISCTAPDVLANIVRSKLHN